VVLSLNKAVTDAYVLVAQPVYSARSGRLLIEAGITGRLVRKTTYDIVTVYMDVSYAPTHNPILYMGGVLNNLWAVELICSP